METSSFSSSSESVDFIKNHHHHHHHPPPLPPSPPPPSILQNATNASSLLKKPAESANLDLKSTSFLLHNGFASPVVDISDIEMIAVHSTVGYTSLKDLLPAGGTSTPGGAVMSPTHNSSWYEVPIKNPLVKHAALAYLQPMLTAPDVGDKGFFGRLWDRCCCQRECGCFGWFNDVVLKGLMAVFWDRREVLDDYFEDDEDKFD